MKKSLKITATEGSVKIVKGKRSYDEGLKYISTVKFLGTFSTPIANRILVSEKTFLKLRGESLVLTDPSTGRFMEVNAYPAAVDDGAIKTTAFIRKELGLSPSSEPILVSNKTAKFTTVKKQRVEDLKSELLEISQEDAEAFALTSGNFTFYRVYNYYTGENITVKSSHIKINPELKQGEMKLQKRQRTFLGLETPAFIYDDFWRELIGKIPDDAIDDKNTILSAYTEHDHFLKKDVSHTEKEAAKDVIFKYMPPVVCVSPVLGSFKRSSRRNVLRVLSDFYVGKATTSLLCRRPYESDEGSDVVRMSLSNMNLLGVNEMDKIVITHNGASVKCRVLKLDDASAFSETNVPTSLNYAIGIPAHVRRKLGIYDMVSSVKVDRDTGFIFTKSLNEQIVPVILTVFSINFLSDPSLWLKSLLSLAAIPVVVFFNLSSKRKMRNQ